MREHEVNAADNFICGWYMDDTSLCDRIVNHFHASPDKQRGMVYVAGKLQFNDAKESTDLYIWPGSQLCL